MIKKQKKELEIETGNYKIGKNIVYHLLLIFHVPNKVIIKSVINTFSIGHDLALMSLCNHTIISHGTFSYWSGYFAGGSVIRPEHFVKYRLYSRVSDKYDI